MTMAFRLWLRSWYRRNRFQTPSARTTASLISQLLGQSALEPPEDPLTDEEGCRGHADQVDHVDQRRKAHVVEHVAISLDETGERVQVVQGDLPAGGADLVLHDRGRVHHGGGVRPHLQGEAQQVLQVAEV